MRRTARIVALVAVGFALLALVLDGLGAWVQPSLGGEEGVLRTTDDDGARHETRLAVFQDESGAIWIQSGHHFRGWYERVKRNPDVELVRNGATNPYRAVAMETPEARRHVRQLIEERVGVAGYYAIRTFLLFAEIKPVRLDPRDARSLVGRSAERYALR